MSEITLTQEEAEARHVRRADYVSCAVAFIDCKKPGSHLKENYSIIGPGVSSSREQVVNLPEPHGFNVGAAAMPHGITNNLHIHFTAEVFLCFAGEWTFRWGPRGDDGEIAGRAGDIVSVPTWIFRGFTNTGPDDGWLFTCLGGDDTGGIIWHPDIIDDAAHHGLYLTADNVLVDTANGETAPPEATRLRTMREEEIAELRRYTPDEMRQRIVTREARDFRPAFIDMALPGCGGEIAPVIGAGMTQNRDHAAPITNPHGFSLEWLRLAPGQAVSPHTLPDKAVLIVFKGSLDVRLNREGDVGVTLAERDTFSVPAHVWRALRCAGEEATEAVIAITGDHRKRPRFADDVRARAAAETDLWVDPGGYVAQRHLLPGSALKVA